MINAILYNLKSPHRIPLKILKKIIFLYKKKKYKKEFFKAEQNKNFKNLNLDRDEGQKKLEKIRAEYKFSNHDMSSEHEILFSSLSLIKELKIEDILEIGTFNGINAYLLSKLFKNSAIDTIDLKSSENDFKNTYNRKTNTENFVNNRDSLLSKSPNIKFIEQNSVKLTFSEKRYDLIWIDGAHGYPVCCIDIINSVKLLKQKGIILVDDVLRENNKNDRLYKSVAAFETLKELEKNKLIKLNFFYKRLDADSNCIKEKIKYLALVKLVD
tara:strand:+ start:2797 stop:3606 length:810 start_codon:yes stop_codon:yes gene_type:complete